ncbi:hypothetical protein ACVH9Z_38160 [Rhodococcus opacus]|uniref:Uncharacterized protein n=1 Tax=Rhodococcus jostii TaxID=132919 RepID=A0A1H4IYM5_RHOJO|nr:MULTISPECIES: hypothetical protein [Rhodococcus]MDJ0420788.1 hypothetical protein [Rhodococcus opacus]MDV7089015.1 hypothetical protein [Rhodococcus opacus]UNN04575.1 hypothetical protein MOO23_36670 [Rhodococcus opacus]WKN52613.1 hypothetical protein HJ581_0001460 [Rhodococcus opacus]SEB38478.1 hypothetical protein SAMN04490220_0603 [Rhodococcus jostii]
MYQRPATEDEIRDKAPGLTASNSGGAFDENGNVVGGTTTYLITVTEPRDGWCTRNDLIDWGYSDAGIDRFFGPESEGPEGITGWTCEHIDHIEATVVVPALRMVDEAFSDPETPASILRAAST